MRRSRLALVVVLACTVVLGGPSVAQQAPRLFTRLDRAPGSVARSALRVRFDGGPLLAGVPRLLLDLPGGGVVAVELADARRRGPASALWRGVPGGGEPGDAVLTLHRGLLAGTIYSRQGEYEIVPSSRGESIVARLAPIADMDCYAPPRTSPASPVPTAAQRTGDGDRVDVLVLYTPGAQERAGGRQQIRARIQSRIDYANTAYAASGMSMRIEAVRVARAPFDDHPTISTMFFTTNDRQVAAMREAVRADLVAVVTDSFECGQAQLLDTLGDTDDVAHSVAALSCRGGEVFTHEIGHNLGFRHDPEYDAAFPRPSVLPYSWAHWRNDGFRTLMAGTWCTNCVILRQFSNPRLEFKGLATGIADERDNARASETTAPHVAAYRRSGRVLGDDFESGNLDAWDRTRGDVEVVGPGLLGSDFALGVPLAGGRRPAYVAHGAGEAEAGIDVDLQLDLSDARLAAAEIEILQLLWHGRVHTRLTLRQAGRPRLALYTLTEGGVLERVAETPLRRGATERVGLQWRRSTAGMVDGRVRLLRGGRDRGGVDDLANDDLGVGQVRLGRLAWVASPGAGGDLRIDDYRAIADPLLPE